MFNNFYSSIYYHYGNIVFSKNHGLAWENTRRYANFHGAASFDRNVPRGKANGRKEKARERERERERRKIHFEMGTA